MTPVGKTSGFLAISLLQFVAIGAPQCEKPSVAGCSIGMTVEQVKALVPNSTVTTSPDGTKLLTGAAGQAFPSMKLGPNIMRVSFDRSGDATEVWLRAETELDEQKVLKSAEAVWGKSETIHGANDSSGLSRRYLMKVSWSERCGAIPQLNVKVTGPPWKSTVHILLQSGAAIGEPPT